jgi:Eukaryotic protein of unknown function (DUF846)
MFIRDCQGSLEYLNKYVQVFIYWYNAVLTWIKQSAHPVVLLFLYSFRIAAITVYMFCGFFTDNYVVSVS